MRTDFKLMKRSGLFALTVCFLMSVVEANAQFEGIVVSKNLTTDETGAVLEYVMTMWIRQDMVKIETKSDGSLPTATMIYRNDKHVIWLLNEDERSYVEMRQDENDQHIRPPGVPGGEEKYSIKKTGKKKTILGYPCEQVVISRAGVHTELWGTTKLGSLFHAISKGLGEEHAEVANGWTDEVMKMGMYPLSSATRVDGRVMESQEVTKIETGSIPINMFELPPDYRKQKVDEMFEGPMRDEEK